MSPLRDNLEQAQADYQNTRYPGDLAADVLARADAKAGPALRLGRSKRGWRDLLAVAAALAAGMGVMFAVMKNRTPPTPEVAIQSSTRETDIIQTETPVAPTQAVIAVGFTAVPDLSAVASAGGTTDFSLNVPTLPMVFSLDSLAEAEAEDSSNQHAETTEEHL